MGLLRDLFRIDLKTNVGAVVPISQSGKPQTPMMSYIQLAREGYGGNAIAFAAIEEWCTDIGEAALCAYQRHDDGDTKVPRGRLVDLIQRPNPYMTLNDLLGNIELHLKVAGNSFTYKERSGATSVVELWQLRPDRIKVIPDAEKFIGGYEYRIDTQTFKLAAEDVIHIKQRHPFDDYYGYPPLMALAGHVDIDNYMRDTVRSFLENMGVPAGILQLSGRFDRQEKELIRNRWKHEFGGRNAGNIMLAEEGATAAFTPMSMNLGQRGLVVPELDEIVEGRIEAGLRVPASLVGARLGSQTASYANKVSDREFFTQQQLAPEWRRIGEALSGGLIPEFPNEADYLAFDLNTVRALAENQDALHARIIGDVGGLILGLHEGRRAAGYSEEIDPEEIFMVPANVVPTKYADLVMALPDTQVPLTQPGI